jgi:hypothetical protein
MSPGFSVCSRKHLPLSNYLCQEKAKTSEQWHHPKQRTTEWSSAARGSHTKSFEWAEEGDLELRRAWQDFETMGKMCYVPASSIGSLRQITAGPAREREEDLVPSCCPRRLASTLPHSLQVF